MSEATTVRVSILDKEYQVSCKPDEVSALQKSASYLDEKMRAMRENSNVVGLDRLAVMAALNLTNELLAQSEKADALDSQQTEIAGKLSDQQTALSSLSDKIDSALERLKPRD